MKQSTNEQLTAERDLWRARALAMLEVMNEVENVADMRRPDGTHVVSGAQWLAAYLAMCREFDAWRRFVEAGVPTDWAVAGSGEPQEIVIDDDEVPF
jgi:hypothetical protein